MTGENVILVDHADAPLGELEKLRAHQVGALHRAFSVFVFRPDGALLLQRRAITKYHSGGLWSNTCCSHPRPGEDTLFAAHRCLREEMGFECGLATAFSFVYRARVGGGLLEHEYDHVLLGSWTGSPQPDPAEVDSWRWAQPQEIRRELRTHPGRFTCWFRIAFDELRVRGLV